MSSVLPMQPIEIMHATVVDNRRETAYRRAGQGEPVLLLAARESASSTELFGALARSHRVYAPVLPTGVGEAPTGRARPELTAWLRGFLDALGVTRISIMADETIGAAAIAFALLDSCRVARVALLLGPVSGESPDAVYDSLGDARIPLLTTWSSSAEGEGLRAIEEFLSCPVSI